MEEDSNPLSASIGEPLLGDCIVHELPGHEESSAGDLVVNTDLMARIEALEAENLNLKRQLESVKPKYFRVEDIESNDPLVRFYTGFTSSLSFLAHLSMHSTTGEPRLRVLVDVSVN